MIQLDFCQRWRDRQDSYRRDPNERINPAEYDVAPIEGPGSDKTARDFVERHHYSGTYPAARFRYGLYRQGALAGVAVFSVPCHKAVIEKPLGVPFMDGVELGRFVLLDDVKWNGETWFLARAFDHLRREGVAGVVSFSDPEPRPDVFGQVRFAGHFGTIYQAHNGVYLGRSKPRSLLLLPNGTVFSERAATKIRAKDRGWRYAVDQLVQAGASAPAAVEDLGAWLKANLPKVTRVLKHRGNHRYAWGLHKAVRRRLVSVGPYPRRTA